jgi:hypothetical protein
MCVEDRVPFDAAMIDDQAKEYLSRHGGFVVDPNFTPNVERNVAMDGIRSSLAQYLSRRAAEVEFVEPRLAEHDLRAEQVQRDLPAVGRGRRRDRTEFENGVDQGYGGEEADGGYMRQFFY